MLGNHSHWLTRHHLHEQSVAGATSREESVSIVLGGPFAARKLAFGAALAALVAA